MNPSNNIWNLNELLKNLEVINGIIGTCLVRSNGLLITSRLPRDIDNRKIGALAATIFGAMENAISAIEGKENIFSITVELDDYQLLILSVDNETIIASLIDLNVNLGLILIEMEETIKKIQNITK